LLPHEFLLDEEPRRAANLLLQDLAAIRERLRLAREMIAPDAHAFAARQAERLDHELEVRVVHELLEARETVERPELREPGAPMERLDDRMLAAPAPDHQDLHDRDAEMVAAGISSFAHSAETESLRRLHELEEIPLGIFERHDAAPGIVSDIPDELHAFVSQSLDVGSDVRRLER